MEIGSEEQQKIIGIDLVGSAGKGPGARPEPSDLKGSGDQFRAEPGVFTAPVAIEGKGKNSGPIKRLADLEARKEQDRR
ncbi:MAG: hypothetical protein ACREE2_21675 [Stellaceae bacterium]